MELHISSDNANYMVDMFNYATSNLEEVDGYVSVCGEDMNRQLQHIVQVNRSSIGDKFPKRVTFGQMLDMMKQAGTTQIYFQREDWRNTHRCVALNNREPKNLFLDEYYENTKLTKDSKPLGVNKYGIPFNKHPFIPTYEDMLMCSWIVYGENQTYKRGDEDEEEVFDTCTF
jgi:hypothetical protein